VSPDSFSNWGVHDKNYHDELAQLVTEFMFSVQIPKFADFLDSATMDEFQDPEFVVSNARKFGINVRHLAYVAMQTCSSAVRTIVLEEVIKRTLKNVVRNYMRNQSSPISGDSNENMVEQKILDFLCTSLSELAIAHKSLHFHLQDDLYDLPECDFSSIDILLSLDLGYSFEQGPKPARRIVDLLVEAAQKRFGVVAGSLFQQALFQSCDLPYILTEVLAKCGIKTVARDGKQEQLVWTLDRNEAVGFSHWSRNLPVYDLAVAHHLIFKGRQDCELSFSEKCRLYFTPALTVLRHSLSQTDSEEWLELRADAEFNCIPLLLVEGAEMKGTSHAEVEEHMWKIRRMKKDSIYNVTEIVKRVKTYFSIFQSKRAPDVLCGDVEFLGMLSTRCFDVYLSAEVNNFQQYQWFDDYISRIVGVIPQKLEFQIAFWNGVKKIPKERVRRGWKVLGRSFPQFTSPLMKSLVSSPDQVCAEFDRWLHVMCFSPNPASHRNLFKEQTLKELLHQDCFPSSIVGISEEDPLFSFYSGVYRYQLDISLLYAIRLLQDSNSSLSELIRNSKCSPQLQSLYEGNPLLIALQVLLPFNFWGMLDKTRPEFDEDDLAVKFTEYPEMYKTELRELFQAVASFAWKNDEFTFRCISLIQLFSTLSETYGLELGMSFKQIEEHLYSRALKLELFLDVLLLDSPTFPIVEINANG
jgi:hypothetical protein